MPMKSGSGNLDFGGGDDSTNEDDESDDRDESVSEPEPGRSDSRPQPPELNPEPEPTAVDADRDDNGDNERNKEQFPYFVRRNNVGDEREERIEVHLRTSVHQQESAFRNQLADELETEEVSKTDAREFALKFAFENPEGVAELMREEGFGLVD